MLNIFGGLQIMGPVIWIAIMAPVSALFTGIGIYAIKRKEPMWFWSGTKVSSDEITDIPAYNRANGMMWIVFSLFFWLSLVLGILNMKIAGLLLFLGCTAGMVFLVVVYGRIYSKYKKK